MIKVVVTRPAQWAGMESKTLDVRYADIGGGESVRLRNGKPCADSVGGVITPAGIRATIQAFEEHKPDVFLWWAHYAPEPRIGGDEKKLANVVRMLHKLRGMRPKALFLYGNGNQQGFPDFNVEAFRPFIDGILVNTRDKREVKMYRSHGIKHVRTLHTFGFDPEEHGRHQNVEPDYDCFFGGSQTADLRTGRAVKFYPRNPMLGGKYPNSKARLDFLRAVASRYSLLVCGKGKWPPPIHAFPYQYGTDYYRVFGRTRICLGFYHWDLERYYTKRTIYSGASGRLLVTKYIPGMEKDFENHKNIVWFKHPSEGLELIKHYLENEQEREQIAAAQRDHFVAKHSWKARLREFEAICNELLG